MTQRLFPSRRFWFYGGLVAVLMAATLTLPALAKKPHPKRHDEYKHQVEKLEEIWRTAQMNADVSAMDQLLSDDYVGITMTGQVVTKTQQLDRMRRLTMVLSRYDVTDRKIKLMGTTAVVTSLAQIEGSNEEQPIHGTFRSTRVYTHISSGGWKITNFEATRVGPGLRSSESAPEHQDESKP